MERPLHACLISPGWSSGLIFEGAAVRWRAQDWRIARVDAGIAIVLIARVEGPLELSVASYLVDLRSRGVKNALGPRPMSIGELGEFRERTFRLFEGRSQEIPIELARTLVFGAVDNARRMGFEPHEDFERARSLLGSGPVEPGIRFGAPPDPEMIPFHSVFPELADRETRAAHVYSERGELPADEYAFLEHYCADPQCDCRRVLVLVVAGKKSGVRAAIEYPFESHQRPRSFLDPGHPQSEDAHAISQFFETKVIEDPEYRARLRDHYAMFKREVAARQLVPAVATHARAALRRR